MESSASLTLLRPLAWASLATPIGTLTIVTEDEGALVAIAFPGETSLARWTGGVDLPPEPNEHGGPGRACLQLREYFAGTRKAFDLALAPRIGSAFQQKVWRTLAAIPFGQTWSYARLASEVGSVARAVGGANGANPIAIVWPCHRVIGADGSLTGYAGGMERKEWLLRHEGAWGGDPQARWF